jgi:putative tricarboxylic transport membrane protein
MSKDLMLGCATLAIAAGYYAMAASIPQSLLADAVGPQKLPQIYAVLLASLSLLVIVRSVLKSGAAGGPPRAVTRWQPAAMLAIGILYLVAVPWLGYMLSLVCVITATAFCQSGRVDRRLLVIAASGAVCFWLLFVALLGIPQPPGVWPSLF